MADALDEQAVCGHCKAPFRWRAALVQRRTPNAAEGRERPRAFCPACGYMVADTPRSDGAWAWHGHANALANPSSSLCPPGASRWGHARVRGVERPLPLLIPDELAAPVGESFIDLLAARAALSRPALERPLPAEPPPAADPGKAEPEALLREALARIRAGELEAAVERLDRALELRPGYAQALSARAYAKAELSDLPGALRDYDAALAAGRSVDALCGRGFVRALSGDEAGAEADFGAALELDARCAAALLNRGILRSSRAPESALEDLERALAADPDNARTRLAKGAVESLLGRSEAALASFDRAAALDPDLAEAAAARGAVLTRLGRNAEALEELGRALKLDPADALSLAQRGTVLYRLGKFREADDDLSRALTLGGEDAFVRYTRGLTRAGDGDVAAATADYDAALRLRPDFPEAQAARVKLGLKPQGLLVSDEMNARIEKFIRGERRRALKNGAAAALTWAAQFWWGTTVEGDWGKVGIACFIIVNPLTILLIQRTLDAYYRSKGHDDPEWEQQHEFTIVNFLRTIGGMAMFSVYFIMGVPTALFSSKQCRHCKTSIRFYARGCTRCGAYL